MYVTPVMHGIQTSNSTPAHTGTKPDAEKECLQEPVDVSRDERADTSFLYKASCGKSSFIFQKETKSDGIGISSSKPQDSSSQLTHRLVASMTQFDVRSVISEANKNLMSLRLTAAIGKGNDAALARAYIKKLEKLIGRAQRKISDLDKEDMIKFRKAKAERQKQKQRAEEIKEELRKKQWLRRARENGYLLEDMQDKILNLSGTGSCPPDASIAAQAEAIAAAEAAASGAADTAGSGASADVAVPTGAGVESAPASLGSDMSISV